MLIYTKHANISFAVNFYKALKVYAVRNLLMSAVHNGIGVGVEKQFYEKHQVALLGGFIPVIIIVRQ